MECANPNYLIDGRFYNWKTFTLGHGLPIPQYAQKIDCRTCVHCRKNRGAELAHCCVLESQEYSDNHFLTLTKKPEYEKEHPKYEKREIKAFIKRLQRWCKKTCNLTPKIYRVHEHGKFGRSHYHLIAFNLPLSDVEPTPRPDTFSSKTISRLWPHGHCTVQNLNHATAMYQSLYLDKDLKNGHANSDKQSVSWHSGIGTKSFLKNYKQWLTLGYIPFGEKKQKIPRKFTRIAQKHLDAFTLTNEQFCFKYSKKNTIEILRYGKTKLCQINIEPIRELAELYYKFKHQPRNEEKNHERINQINKYLQGERKQMPDFHVAGENTIYNQLNKIEKDKL